MACKAMFLFPARLSKLAQHDGVLAAAAAATAGSSKQQQQNSQRAKGNNSSRGASNSKLLFGCGCCHPWAVNALSRSLLSH